MKTSSLGAERTGTLRWRGLLLLNPYGNAVLEGALPEQPLNTSKVAVCRLNICASSERTTSRDGKKFPSPRVDRCHTPLHPRVWGGDGPPNTVPCLWQAGSLMIVAMDR